MCINYICTANKNKNTYKLIYMFKLNCLIFFNIYKHLMCLYCQMRVDIPIGRGAVGNCQHRLLLEN